MLLVLHLSSIFSKLFVDCNHYKISDTGNELSYVLDNRTHWVQELWLAISLPSKETPSQS